MRLSALKRLLFALDKLAPQPARERIHRDHQKHDQDHVIGDFFPILCGLDRLRQHQADATAHDRPDDRGRARVGLEEI